MVCWRSTEMTGISALELCFSHIVLRSPLLTTLICSSPTLTLSNLSYAIFLIALMTIINNTYYCQINSNNSQPTTIDLEQCRFELSRCTYMQIFFNSKYYREGYIISGWLNSQIRTVDMEGPWITRASHKLKVDFQCP